MFYVGIVEDNKDPMKLGRLRVRILGIHTENRSKNVGDISKHIPVTDLPWAFPAMPMTNSNIDGISDFGMILAGTRVLCCFLDENKQKPICLAVLPSFVTELPNFEKGFSDPNKLHPKDDYLNESSISRLARNEKIDKTFIQNRKDSVVDFETCGQTIHEPETEYDAKYPYNRVIETTAHIIEIDDTPNKERIHAAHKSGTFVEIFPDGRVVFKSNKDNFSIVNGSQNTYYKDDENKRVGRNLNLEVVGDTKIILNGTSTIEAKKELKINASEKVSINTTGDVNLTGANTNIISTGNLKLDSTGNLEIDCGNANINASGNVIVTGSIIALN